MYDEDYDNEEEEQSNNGNNGNGFNFKEFYEENKKLILIVGGFLIILLILTIISKAGGGGTGGDSGKFALNVSSTEESIRKNGNTNIIAKVTGTTNPKYEWTSSDTNVATVDQNGTVSAVDLGSCVITVTVTNDKGETKTANVNVTVYNGTEGVALTAIKFGGEGLVITKGNTFPLKVTTEPSDAYISDMQYNSDNESVCSVNANGIVTANQEGLCTVTVKANQTASDDIKVYVKNENVTSHYIVVPTDITFEKTEITLKVEESQTINVSTTPANADSSILTFTAGDSSIIKIEGNVVTGLAEGTTNVTVKAGNITKTINVTVTKKTVDLTGISVGSENLSISVNGTEQIIVDTIPAGATGVTFSYTTSDSSVATVSSTGLITGVKAGTATITITANNGGNDVTKTINVTVNGSSGSQDPPSGGGSCSSVGSIRVTSDNNAVNKTKADVERSSELKNAPSKITMELGNCTDTVKYCLYKDGESPCTPNITYTAPFTINQNGITIIRYIVYYNGSARQGDPTERFVRLQNGTGSSTTQTSSCWKCGNSFIWDSSKPLSTCVATINSPALSQSNCTSLNSGKLCFKKETGTDAGKWFWGASYATMSGYKYFSNYDTQSSCESRNS